MSLHVSACLCMSLHVVCHTGLSPSTEPSVHGVGPSLGVKLSHEHLRLSLAMRNLHHSTHRTHRTQQQFTTKNTLLSLLDWIEDIEEAKGMKKSEPSAVI